MKYLVLLIFLFSALMSNAQVKLVPGKKAVDKKWIKGQKYQMIWYTLRDTAKVEFGRVETGISNADNKITVVTQVSLTRMKTSWIDSSVASAENLQPIYHSSYNVQRDMVLNFGKIVTGYYNDKTKKVTTQVNDTTHEDYFDSNLYPAIITWLPLKEGYKQDLSIYDYNPAAKIGVLKASVLDVKKGTYQSEKSGDHAVWVVTVTDEIGGANSSMVYYVDVADRRLWKQEIDLGGRKMLMLRVEN